MVDLRVQRTAAAGGFVLVAAVGTAAVLNYGFGVALTWLLPQDQFGVVGVLQSLLSLAAFVLTAGFPWAVARVMAQTERSGGGPDADVAVRGGIAGNVALGVALAVGFVAVQASPVPLLPGVGWGWTAAIACALALLSLSNVLSGALQGARRFDAVGVTGVAEIVVKVALGIALVALLGWGVSGVFLAVLAGVVVAVAAAWWSARDKLPGFGPVAGGPALREAAPMALGTVAFGLLATTDVLLLSTIGREHGITAATVAVYQAASILARAPYFLSDALSDAVFPFVAGERTGREAHRWFMTAFRWVPTVFVPALLVLVIAPASVVGLVFPDGYAEAAEVARVLAVGTIGLIAADMVRKALFARGMSGAVALRLPVAAVVQVLALVVLVPPLGAVGAASAFAVGTWVAAGLLGAHYLAHHRPGRVRLHTVRSWAGAVVVLCLLLGAAAASPHPLDLALVAAAVVAYAVMAVRLRLLPDALLTRAHRIRVPLALEGRRGLLTGSALAAGVLVACTAFWWNVGSSPDTMYDEVSYVVAAQNVARDWSLTWTNQPVFVHPPLSFLAEAGWLRLLGVHDAPVEQAVPAGRILASTVSVLALMLFAVIAARLATAAGPRRRLALGIVVLALAATDPILLRYLRLVLIEPFALLASAVALLCAIALRRQPALLYVPVVGLATGIALLTKEVSIVLVAVPVVHALLGRDGRAFARTAGALTAGVAIWAAFPLWALQLGLGSQFAAEKLLLVERLFGFVQTTGWNRPGFSFGSFLGAVLDAASEYTSSYVLLATGFAALVWLVLHRGTDVSRWLLAWLLLSYGYASYTVLLGSLNEHLFVFVMPAAIVGTVLVADAVVARRTAVALAHGRAPRRELLMPAVALLGVLAFAATGWVRSYVPDGDGVFRSAAFVRAAEASCAVNAIGDGGKWAPALPGHLVTEYATGPAARSHGVTLFFLSGKDAATGNALPELPAWVTTNGTLVASFPSVTYRGIELWEVPRDPYDPLVDVDPVDNGVFVTTEGSRCAGHLVVDEPDGSIASAWHDLGGKAVIGPPATERWVEGGEVRQVFAGAVVAASAERAGAAVPVVEALATRYPQAYRDALLPPVTESSAASLSDQQVRDLLTDPAIAAAYLGEPLDRARYLLGDPIGPPTEMPDGVVRQPFAGGVLEHPAGSTDVRSAPVGRLALDVGLVAPPEDARTAEPPPPLPEDVEPAEPSSVEPFVRSLGIVLALYIGLPVLGIALAGLVRTRLPVRGRR